MNEGWRKEEGRLCCQNESGCPGCGPAKGFTLVNINMIHDHNYEGFEYMKCEGKQGPVKRGLVPCFSQMPRKIFLQDNRYDVSYL